MANVLVTGANRGIGLGLVREFLKDPSVARIFATTRDPASAKELQAVRDTRLTIVKMAVDDDESIRKAADKVSKIVGDAGLDILVNNAGIAKFLVLKTPIDRKALMDQFNVNTFGPMVVTSYFYELLKKAAAKKGTAQVANISATGGSSTLCKGPFHNYDVAAYFSSKSALNRYTKYASKDFAPEKIRVTAFCPGWIKTNLGTQDATYTIDEKVPELAKLILNLRPEHNGGYFRGNGEVIPW